MSHRPPPQPSFPPALPPQDTPPEADLFAHLPCGLLLVTGHRLWLNPWLRSFLQWPAATPPRRSLLWSLVRPADRRLLLRTVLAALQDPQAVVHCEIRLERQPQELSVCELTCLRPAPAAPLQIFLRDLTTEERLRESRKRYRQLLSLLPDAVFQVDLETRTLLEINDRFAALLGYEPQELLGQPLSRVLDPAAHPPAQLDAFYTSIPEEGGIERETWVCLRKNGSRVYLERSGSTSRCHGRRIVLLVGRDVSSRLAEEERLRYLGFHDALTGLYNRTRFEEVLDELTLQPPDSLGVILCDLERLKRVNDRWGHAAGDRMIVEAAAVLRRCFRRDDLVSRIGGDEFVILLPDVPQELVLQKCRAICDAAAKVREHWPQGHFGITVGWAHGGDRQRTPRQLIAEADRRMYACKEK